MAKQKREIEQTDAGDADDFSAQLIKDLNKQFGSKVAYNLLEDEAPTNVKRWIDTGSVQLNYLIKNAPEGGFPEGRIIEVSGLPSTGKSHLAYAAAANVQRVGGLVVYIDTENATMLSKLHQMGIDVKRRFVFCESSQTEEVFSIIESTILKAKQLMKDVPILVVWDSVAATSPKAELEADYDQNSMGLQARVLSKGFRKITQIIGQNNVTLLCLNQVREAIGQMHGDPLVTPGGKALPFQSSVRVRLGSGNPVKDKNGQIVGSHVTVTIKKNKVAIPHRKCEFDIIFGKGIVEDEYVFDEIRAHSDNVGGVVKNGKKITCSGSGAWKELLVTDTSTGEVIANKKFYKNDFGALWRSPEWRPWIDQLIESAYTLNPGDDIIHDESDDDTPTSDDAE